MIYHELHLQKLCPIFGGSSIMGSFVFVVYLANIDKLFYIC